jgi:dynein heavy chain 1
MAWLNGMHVIQIKVHSQYSALEFERDLRELLIRAGCQRQRVCFIFDESNALKSSFLERMHAFFVNGKIPGLFQGEERERLLQECREIWS